MRKYQTLIGFTVLSIAIIISSLILGEAIQDLAIKLVRVLQIR